MKIEKYKKIKNYEDIYYLYNSYNNIKDFIDENISDNLIKNINKFIKYFKNDFKISKEEQKFIYSCFFEYDYFKKAIKIKINKNKFKKIIVEKVMETLNDISKYSDIIENTIILCNLKNNIKNNTNHNYKVIKKIIKSKSIGNNYCFLFDNIKYFKEDINKLKSYATFIDLILDDYLETKSYY